MSTARVRGVLLACSAMYVAALIVSACSSQPSASPAKTDAAKPPQFPMVQLWGEMKPIVSVKQLMADFIDPASDYIFDSVATVVTKGKVVETIPHTDADWDKVRMGGVMLAEGVYLLKVPRPFAPPGDENNSTGPEPEELAPAAITAKLEKDPVLWNAKIEALRNVGLEVMDIVKRKDANELWDAAENLDQACENCHLEFWYPGEKVLLNKLDRKRQELYGARAGGRKLGMDPK